MQKTILCLLTICIALPTLAFAECEVKFQWTPQEKSDEVAGYMIFCREKGNDYDYNTPIWEGDNTFLQCTIDKLDESKTYYFVIRAVDRNDNQSYDSPEVEFIYNGGSGSSDGSGSSSGSGSSGGLGAGIGGDGYISTSTSFSSCFLQSLSGSN
jgi:uncharacterized membrane protein YgcG